MNIVADAKAKLAIWIALQEGKEVNAKWSNLEGLAPISIKVD